MPRSDRPDDETLELLRRCKDGDRAALDELVTRFYPPVFRMLRARVGQTILRKEDLEDLVQETFLKVIDGIEDFESRPEAHFIAYLAQVAHNTVLGRAEYYGAAKRDTEREVSAERVLEATRDTVVDYQSLSDTQSVPGEVARQEMEEIVDDCLSELDEAQREVILLRDYAGADWRYVAEKLDRISVGAVQQLHRRARARLAELVQRRM